MALSKLTYNSFNVTPTASKGIGFDSGADDLAATFSGGATTFIKKLTASSDSTLSFVNGASDVVLDGTYKEYLFIFNNIHPETNSVTFTVNFSDDTSSHSYDLTKTTSAFAAYHDESDAGTVFAYRAASDLAQGTGVQQVMIGNISSDSDHGSAGYMRLFNPASTTFVKHFIIKTAASEVDDGIYNGYVAGYINTTAAVTAVQFACGSGDIDAGTISLYGIN